MWPKKALEAALLIAAGADLTRLTEWIEEGHEVGADDGPAGGAEFAGAAVEVDTTLLAGGSQCRRCCFSSVGGAPAALATEEEIATLEELLRLPAAERSDR
jgi:hypothetical protein